MLQFSMLVTNELLLLLLLLPFDYYHLQDLDGLGARANLSDFIAMHSDEEPDELPSRPGLFDVAEEVEEEDEFDLKLAYPQNKHLSTRSCLLYGDGRVLVPGKDQMLAVDGTVT
jgi:hypothetical protein